MLKEAYRAGCPQPAATNVTPEDGVSPTYYYLLVNNNNACITMDMHANSPGKVCGSSSPNPRDHQHLSSKSKFISRGTHDSSLWPHFFDVYTNCRYN